MKKGWKIFWIVCLVVFCIGAALCATGVGLGATWEAVQGNLPDWISLGGTSSYNVEKEYEYGEVAGATASSAGYENIRSIDVEASALNLQIVVSDEIGEEVQVEIDDDEFAEKINHYQESETLVIETNNRFKVGNDVGTVWIYIPRAQFDEIEIDVEAGSVYVEEIMSNSLHVSVDAGEAVVKYFEATEVDFECGAGRVEASGKCNRELDANCGAGEIVLAVSGKKEDYNYEIECGIGEVIIGNDSHSGMGNREEYFNGAEKEMSIECGIGSISVAFEE